MRRLKPVPYLLFRTAKARIRCRLQGLCARRPDSRIFRPTLDITCVRLWAAEKPREFTAIMALTSRVPAESPYLLLQAVLSFSRGQRAGIRATANTRFYRIRIRRRPSTRIFQRFLSLPGRTFRRAPLSGLSVQPEGQPDAMCILRSAAQKIHFKYEDIKKSPWSKYK